MTNPPLINLRIAPYVIPDKRDMFQAAEVRLLPLFFFAENEEKTWGELDCFCPCSIAENPYISRVFDARSSKQHWGFWIRVAPVYIAAPRRAKLFFENKKVLSRSRERTSKQNDAKSQAKSMRNYAKSMRNEAKFVSHISFIGFRKQVAGRVRQEKCSESVK